MKRKARVEVGSISTGTLRTEDLLLAFADELERLSPRGRMKTRNGIRFPGCYTHARLIREARELARKLFDDTEKTSGETDQPEALLEEADSLVTELSDALSALAPEGLYFGTCEGDGADFGFWPSQDFLARPEDHEAIKVNGLDQVPPDHYGIVLEVNDHGNVTCYHRSRNNRLVELWSCV